MRIAQAEDLFDRLIRLAGFRQFHLTLSPIWAYLEYLPEYEVECSLEALAALNETRARSADAGARREIETAMRAERHKLRRSHRLGRLLRHALAGPMYRAAGVAMPPPPRRLLDEARELLPTLRPHGELALYVGEVLLELRAGIDIFFSLAPAGCMVTTMGDVLTPRLQATAGKASGRIQSLFSADGEIDEELLALALLKARGPKDGTGAPTRRARSEDDADAGALSRAAAAAAAAAVF